MRTFTTARRGAVPGDRLRPAAGRAVHGGVITRAEDLAGEKDCRPSKGTYRLDDVRIARTQRFTDVLVRREGRWQLVAGHASRVP